MSQIVRLEVRGIKVFRQPAKPYRHGIGTQSWDDKGLLIEGTGGELEGVSAEYQP